MILVYYIWVIFMDFKVDSVLLLILLNLLMLFLFSVFQGLLVVFLLLNNCVNIWYMMGFLLGWLMFIFCFGVGLMIILLDGCWYDNSKGVINVSVVVFIV